MKPTNRAQARARCPPAHSVTLRSLKPAEQQLLEIMRQLGYGRLTDIRMSGGELILHAGFKVCHRHRLDRVDDGAPPELEPADYVLKEAHLALIAQIRAVPSGRIARIEVQDGLPVHLEIEQEFRRQMA